MKTLLITGAGRGIGLALTKELSKQAFTVLATYRSASSAKELLDLAKSNPNIVPVTADVTDEKTFGPLLEQLKKIGTLDILINNSGVIGDKARSLQELDMKVVAETFKVNTFGPMLVSRLALPFLNKSGTIAQITSMMGSIADSTGGYYDYRMSKAALNMFNNCLSKEFPTVTCLTLHPGWVQTEMGGPGAKISTEECARGLCKLILQAKLNQSGSFFDYTGKTLAW